MCINELLKGAVIISIILAVSGFITYKMNSKGKPKVKLSKFYVIYFVVAVIVIIILLLFLKQLFLGFLAETE